MLVLIVVLLVVIAAHLGCFDGLSKLAEVWKGVFACVMLLVYALGVLGALGYILWALAHGYMLGCWIATLGVITLSVIVMFYADSEENKHIREGDSLAIANRKHYLMSKHKYTAEQAEAAIARIRTQ